MQVVNGFASPSSWIFSHDVAQPCVYARKRIVEKSLQQVAQVKKPATFEPVASLLGGSHEHCKVATNV